MVNINKYIKALLHPAGLVVTREAIRLIKLETTKKVNPNLAKPPLHFSGGLTKLGLTYLVK